ncbi:MAG: 50S ribosomal protein L10 [SAR202 cluster bacterium]|nr:50S ribosomal protein L10 [SAR202 cluster bacterium]
MHLIIQNFGIFYLYVNHENQIGVKLPSEKNIQIVEDLKGNIESSSILIATDYSGVNVAEISTLRAALREQGVQFKVVRNTLALIAADQAGNSKLKELIEGPTSFVFGFEDPVEPVRVLTKFIKDSGSKVKVRGALMGDSLLTTEEVDYMASLPDRPTLLSQLLGQLQAPISSLATVLNAPTQGLVTLLDRYNQNQEK